MFAEAQTITLDGKNLEISGKEPVTITRPAVGVTISGNKLSDDLQVENLAVAKLSDLTFTGGDAGGIENDGTLTLNDCTVTGNSASNFDGGIYNDSGKLTLNDCTVSGNSGNTEWGIKSAASGAATPTLIVTDSNVSGNTGGGIINIQGTATLTDSTVSENTGDGIFNEPVGNDTSLNNGVARLMTTLTLTGCTVSGNAGTGISAGGTGA